MSSRPHGRPEVPLDPGYTAARRVLLDALVALEPHKSAVIVAGAQAIYMRTGDGELAVAPYTTDGDLAIDPRRLADSPELENAMRRAGFELSLVNGNVEPGTWIATATVDGSEVIIPVDLIVPEGVAAGGGRRGARLGVHGRRAARRANGLEAVLVDHSSMRIAALDPRDERVVEAQVAGEAALLVAKARKIQDRQERRRAGRIDDKDAADVVRFMQITDPSASAPSSPTYVPIPSQEWPRGTRSYSSTGSSVASGAQAFVWLHARSNSRCLRQRSRRFV